MKRFLLPASALVLVVTACGAGIAPAPRLTEVRTRLPTVRARVAQRERAALGEARRLEREFVAPPGARRDRARRDHGGILHQSGRGPFGEVVTARRFWRVQEPLAAVTAFVKAHDPLGFRVADSYHSTRNRYVIRTLDSPPGLHRVATRVIDETIAALPGRTVIRVDASVAWIYPRSPAEAVPSATRKIVVRAPRVSRTVTDPAKVAQIVRWFDALPVYPPGIAVACPAVISDHITLSFRTARGARPARATMPATTAGVCDPIAFRIHGTAKEPLIDRPSGESFARRVERLLGIHIPRHPRLTPKG